MKQIIRLTESDLHMLIEEVLNEMNVGDIRLPDGRIMSAKEYKKMLNAQKKERLQVQPEIKPKRKKPSLNQAEFQAKKLIVTAMGNHFKSIKYIRGFMKFAPVWFGGRRVNMFMKQGNIERRWYNCQRLAENFVNSISEAKNANSLTSLKTVAEKVYLALDDVMHSINNFLIAIKKSEIRQIWDNDPIFKRPKYGINDIQQVFLNDIKMLPTLLNNLNKQLGLGFEESHGIENPVGITPIGGNSPKQTVRNIPTNPSPFTNSTRRPNREEPMKSPFKNDGLNPRRRNDEPMKSPFKW